ncbi:hypothetical protein KFL_012140020 [Klebsormidium nitens]|uniref:Reverse transcriptase Ty1/copia-type domain-containing protein n=1 Tax=Klebsormidium nitens TaxID=105231 RepID=A0A1Y1IPZ8_KLENI|nr:hypothetical protein KFL_012140020 [Klebsormidium nitens]|eukprot:GAQ92940.1 hypothetical protein KFL_012140020 [Klebsormidium nitens]
MRDTRLESCTTPIWRRMRKRGAPQGTWEHPETENYQEAVGGEKRDLWRKSMMDDKMRSLLDTGTWKIVEKPERVKPQPQGYEQGGPEMVCRLKRTLYGLRQSLRAWHMRLKEELKNFEFVASMADAALFTRIVAGKPVHLVVWVDDILVAACGAERIAKMKKQWRRNLTCAIWTRQRASSEWS